MSKKQETIADIVAEMRKYASDYYQRSAEWGGDKGNPGMFYLQMAQAAKVFAGRIEAAHKREVEAITAKLEEARHCWKVWSERADELKNKCDEQYAKLKSVGNADIGNGTKMREALVQVELFLSRVERHGHPTLNPGDRCDACEGTEELRALVCAALAEPRRNCDVYNSETCRMAYHMKGLGLMTMQAFADWLFASYESEVAK